MTNAEAIATLQANYPDACYEQLREAVDKAIDALKKQIPQKPKMPLDAYWVCPVCRSKIEHPFEHCRRCGQKISWEEDEE